MDVKVRRLGYALGAQVTGFDLTQPLDDAAIARIRKEWLEHLVLCFPRQDLSYEQLLAFAARFGTIDDNRASPHLRHPDHPGLIVFVNKPVTIGEKSFNGQVADTWHSDNSYTVRPTTATFLGAKELPQAGGNTMFANMYAAFDRLSPGMQRMIEPLEAVHDVTLGAGFRAHPERAAERRRLHPPVAHPVVPVHPETGRKSLYLGQRARRFVGMTEEESQPLLDFLNRHATAYELTYRHRWELHDLVMWDNRCALHYAVRDYDRSQLRSMLRCSLLGDKTGRVHGEEASTPEPASVRAPAS